ncbi:BgMFREP2 precursor [Biomphalaria glabrata]|nr:BgMFREP2 precursor [Biomphalaria glabrata]
MRSLFSYLRSLLAFANRISRDDDIYIKPFLHLFLPECPKDKSAKEPVYKYEIFLDYTSTLQKKATHLCLDMSAVLSLWPFSSMTDTILSSFFLWKYFNHGSCEGYLKSIAYLSRKTSID